MYLVIITVILITFLILWEKIFKCNICHSENVGVYLQRFKICEAQV